jgi:hypothetical protein
MDPFRNPDNDDTSKYRSIVNDWDWAPDWHDERTVVVSGYLGQPAYTKPGKVSLARPGYWRLFRTLNLDEYIEFLELDVVHIEQQPSAPGQDQRLVPVIIWLREGARVRPIRVHDFLVGEVANQYMPEADLAARLGEERRLQPFADPAAGSFAGCTNQSGCGGTVSKTAGMTC